MGAYLGMAIGRPTKPLNVAEEKEKRWRRRRT